LKKYFIIFAVISVILSACFSPWEGGDNAVITLNFGGANNRSIFGNFTENDIKPEDILEHKITVSGPGVDLKIDVEKGKSTAQITVAPGRYKITVDAYINDADLTQVGLTLDDLGISNETPKYLIARGSDTVNVIAGKNNPVAIEMEPYGGGGNSNQTPVLDDYNITGDWAQTEGSVKEILVEAKEGKSSGVVTVLYDGSETVPQTIGNYAVTFNVAAAAGWNAASGLIAGTLEVNNKLTPDVIWPSGLEAIYGQSLSEILLDYTNDPAGTFEWTHPADLVGEVGKQFHSMTFTPDDTATYNPVTEEVEITVNPVPIYGISLSRNNNPLNQTSGYAFTAANVFNYSNVTPLEVTVTNTGNQPTGTLTIELSGANDTSFELSKTSITDIAVAEIKTDAFTVAPTNGLDFGHYTAKVTVTGNNDISVSFEIIFSVFKLNGITINTNSVKRAYLPDETLDLTGLEVTATYSSGGSNAVVQNYTSSPTSGTVLTEKTTVEITYAEGEISYSKTFVIYVSPFIVTNIVEYNDVLAAIRTSGNGSGSGNTRNYTIAIANNISGITPLTSAPTNSTGFGTVTDLSVTLTSSGTYTMDIASSGSMFYLGNGQTLIIDGDDLTLRGRSDNNAALIYIGGGINSTLELKNGIISGNTNSLSSGGGGVRVIGGGTFTMTGGKISGNTSNYGGGVIVINGKFIMTGGEISGNTGSNGGGGVYVETNGVFYIVNGTIYGTDASPDTLRNISTNGAALRLINGNPPPPAQHGNFTGSNGEWESKGNLIASGEYNRDNTIRVENGKQIYFIGDTGPGGGKIFYYDADGFTVQMVNSNENYTARYLEAAPNDMETPLVWSNDATVDLFVAADTSYFIGGGRKNTAVILSKDALAPAAKACNDLNLIQGGKTDWYLPSEEELNKLYQNKTYVGDLTGTYWSSTLYNANNVYTQNFYDGGLQEYFNIKGSYLVRAIRAF